MIINLKEVDGVEVQQKHKAVQIDSLGGVSYKGESSGWKN